mgnify:CR=1 FL=1
MKTLRSNFLQHLRAISRSQLPETFLNVIAITHSLGVCYLWIDSLCIIQDDEGNADWKQESARMADYYHYSLLTTAEMWTSFSS